MYRSDVFVLILSLKYSIKKINLFVIILKYDIAKIGSESEITGFLFFHYELKKKKQL